MTQTFSRTLALVCLAAFVSLASMETAASGVTGRWVVRVPNGDGTFRETVFVLNQSGSTLTGSVINPSSEQPFVEAEGLVQPDRVI